MQRKTMNYDDVFNIAAAILASVGGSAIIIVGLSSWLGKVWANRILEKDKLKVQKEYEDKVVKLTKEFRDKREKQLEELSGKMEKMYSEVLKHLTTVSGTLSNPSRVPENGRD